MSKWFPDVSDAEGINEARKVGLFGTLAFAAMIVIGVAVLLITNRTPVMDQSASPAGALVVMGAELAFVLFVAWRFKEGKGAYVGPLLVILYLVEIVAKVASGTTNIGWMIAYAAIFVGLINGVRSAWANKSQPTDASVFE